MKIFPYIRKNGFLLLMLGMLVSCEEVIEIDLNSSNPVLVVEGKIIQDSLAHVYLSLTSDYFSVETSEVISDALITLSDSDGNSETLEYIENGMYLGRDIIGVAGNTYFICIEKDDSKYYAESMLMSPVKIHEVNFVENTGENIVDIYGSESEETDYRMELRFSDDSEADNFYMIKFWNNGEELGDRYVLISDDYTENDMIGIILMKAYFEDGNYRLEVISIDEESYDYYSQLNDLSNDLMGSYSTPYNPISNFGSNVMGCFTAISYDSRDGRVLVHK